LDAADIWCAEVLDWPKLFSSDAFREIDMVQTLIDGQGIKVRILCQLLGVFSSVITYTAIVQE
jgi:crotonobetainyl-CoA:carnitine CoA-transferase CaiB-like acyl-CoA transferase